jgi:hypothetical protein
LTDELTVTNSTMTTWQDCRRRWFLGYYMGYQQPPGRRALTSAALLGTRLHKALELHYGYRGDARAALGVLYDEARSEAASRLDVAAAKDLDAEHTLALTMLDGYLDWAERGGLDYDLVVIRTEQDVQVESGYPGVRFRGKLDQVVRRESDNAILFHDWKTTGSFDMLVPTLHLNPQARFYTLLSRLWEESDAGGRLRVDGGLFTMMRRSQRTARAKPPFYRREEVRFNDDELRATQYKSVAIALEIQAATAALDHEHEHADDTHLHVAYPNPTRDCSWKCPFMRVCPLLDDGSDWRGAMTANYVQADPYSYYDGGDNAQILGQIDARKGTDR